MKVLIAAFASFLLLTCAQGQVQSSAAAARAYRVDSPKHWDFIFDKPLLEYDRLLKQPGTLVAVRVCSNEPLAKAVVLSGTKPLRVADYMSLYYRYAPERVLFLRSEECHSGAGSISTMEVWVVPQGAELPPADERTVVQQAEKFFKRVKRPRAVRKVTRQRRI